MTLGMSGACQRPTTVPESVTCPDVPHGTSTAGALRSEPCLCGQLITAPWNEPRDWVYAHNQTFEHMAWRRRHQL